MRRGVRAGSGSAVGRVVGFLKELEEKAGDDNIFFLASGLTFNLLLAALPFLALLVAAAGLILASQLAEPGSTTIQRLWQLVPAAGAAMPGDLRDQVATAVENAASLGAVSAVLFAWFSTRLLGSLRTVLSEIFDLRDRRGIVEGKLMDFGLVLVSTALLLANVALSTAFTDLGVRSLDLLGIRVDAMSGLVGWMAAVLFVFVMFLLIYKYLPARHLTWRTAISAAAVAAAGFELLKAGFAFYLSRVADVETAFSAFLTPIVFVVSLYYGAVLFVLAGEIAQLLQERRRIRRQWTRLD